MELKPCPFCGSIYITIKEHHHGSYLNPEFYLLCEHCGVQGPIEKRKEAVTKHWNTRANELKTNKHN